MTDTVFITIPDTVYLVDTLFTNVPSPIQMDTVNSKNEIVIYISGLVSGVILTWFGAWINNRFAQNKLEKTNKKNLCYEIITKVRLIIENYRLMLLNKAEFYYTNRLYYLRKQPREDLNTININKEYFEKYRMKFTDLEGELYGLLDQYRQTFTNITELNHLMNEIESINFDVKEYEYNKCEDQNDLWNFHKAKTTNINDLYDINVIPIFEKLITYITGILKSEKL